MKHLIVILFALSLIGCGGGGSGGGGTQQDLSGADLTGVDLSDAELGVAQLSTTDGGGEDGNGNSNETPPYLDFKLTIMEANGIVKEGLMSEMVLKNEKSNTTEKEFIEVMEKFYELTGINTCQTMIKSLIKRESRILHAQWIKCENTQQPLDTFHLTKALIEEQIDLVISEANVNSLDFKLTTMDRKGIVEEFLFSESIKKPMKERGLDNIQKRYELILVNMELKSCQLLIKSLIKGQPALADLQWMNCENTIQPLDTLYLTHAQLQEILALVQIESIVGRPFPQ